MKNLVQLIVIVIHSPIMHIHLREQAGRLKKSASDIARETGLNRNTVNALMRGSVADVRLSTLKTICATYGLTLADLIEESVMPETSDSPLPSAGKPYKQEGELVPFTCWPVMMAAGAYVLEHRGRLFGFGRTDLHIRNDYGALYWDSDALRALAVVWYEKYSSESLFEALYASYRQYASMLEFLYEDIRYARADAVDERWILSVMDRLRVAYDGFWTHSLFIDAFDVGTDQEIIRDVASRHGLNTVETGILSTPIEMTFADERRLALLSIVCDTFQYRAHVSGERLRASIKKHADEVESFRYRFDYYRSNYAHVIRSTPNEILLEMESLIGSVPDIRKEYHRLRGYSSKKSRDVAVILKRHHLQSNPLWLFARLTAWREQRKKTNLMGIHVMDFLLTALAERTGIGNNDLKYLSFDEVGNVLRGFVTADTLKRRRIEGVLISVSGDRVRIFESEEAQSVRQDLEAALSSESTDVLSGQTASQGYAKGVARVILTREDFSRFSEGEVLVTSMTRPEFVPLMQKACAIVTGEGGVTCHAAIVSRELGKPCIIGVRGVLRHVSDGDVIEVRANHGTIRLLERNEDHEVTR